MANKNAIPPEHGKFKKGQSGNPNGRPQGALNMATRMRRFLDVVREVENPITKQVEKISVGDEIDLKQIAKAINGDTYAWEKITDRLEGKPRQTQEHTGPDGGPIDVRTEQTVIKIAFRHPAKEGATDSDAKEKPKGSRRKGS